MNYYTVKRKLEFNIYWRIKEMILKEQILSLLQDVAGGLPYLDAVNELENFNFWEDNKELSNEEQEELGRLISRDHTSGRLDSEDGTCVAWQLNWNKWKED